MTPEQFFDLVESHEELQGLSIEVNKDGVAQFVVLHTPSHLKTVVTGTELDRLDNTPKNTQTLIDILVGKQEPKVLFHLTRVVGYYSRTDNWNASKIGELADRHAGNYAIL